MNIRVLLLLSLIPGFLGSGGNQATAENQEALQTRGLVRSSARVEIRTDLVANINKAPFVDGQRFSKGDMLIEFDCARYFAELNAAKATAHAARIEARDKKRLFANGAAGKSEVQLANANAARTRADTKVRIARVEDCTIMAPFSGRVVALNARQHEMPSPEKPIVVLIDDSKLELELVVPSNWLRWLAAGKKFNFMIDETGRQHVAEITRLGAEIDAVSQTIKAYGILKGDLGSVLAGMSGVASFESGRE